MSLALYRASARRWSYALWGDPVARVLTLPRGRDGYARYERVRELGPLVRGRTGLFMTASYSLCNDVLRSDAFGVVPSSLARTRLRPLAWQSSPLLVHPLDDSFASVDPPEHARLRRVVAPWFTPKAMQSLRGFVERTVDASLDRLDSGDTVDLVTEYALQVPSRVICELLGLPAVDHERFVRWGIEFGRTVDGSHTPGELRRTHRLLGEMADYFTDALAQRRRRPGEDALSRLVAAQERGEMTERGVLATSEALLIGGFVTTANIIGNGAHALLSNPEQRDAFVARPELAANVVEEVLRLEAPAQYSVRVAREATTVGGLALARRTPIVLLLAGANRDPSAFPEPDCFDITRPNARKHLSFAAGIHYCIGAGLARLEGELALRALFERFPGLRLDGRVRHCPSRVIRGPARLPVRC